MDPNRKAACPYPQRVCQYAGRACKQGRCWARSDGLLHEILGDDAWAPVAKPSSFHQLELLFLAGSRWFYRKLADYYRRLGASSRSLAQGKKKAKQYPDFRDSGHRQSHRFWWCQNLDLRFARPRLCDRDRQDPEEGWRYCRWGPPIRVKVKEEGGA